MGSMNFVLVVIKPHCVSPPFSLAPLPFHGKGGFFRLQEGSRAHRAELPCVITEAIYPWAKTKMLNYPPEWTTMTGIAEYRIVSRAVLPKKALSNAFLP